MKKILAAASLLAILAAVPAFADDTPPAGGDASPAATATPKASPKAKKTKKPKATASPTATPAAQ